MPTTSLYKNCTKCNKGILVKAALCPHCGTKQRKFKTHFVLIIVAALLFYLLISTKNTENYSSTTPISDQIDIDSEYKRQVAEQLELKFSWTSDGFGHVMIGDFTVKNKSSVDIKDIKISCDHYGKSGTKIDSNDETIYDLVKGKSKKMFNDVNMGFIHDQASSTSCQIKDFELA